MDALAEVYDPELDEPITRLGFVTSCEVSSDGDVEVVLRLPTPQCAPNFAFLMAADARRAVRRLPAVREVTIRLEDHYTGQEINAALVRGEGFAGAFPGETVDDDLAALRELFLRKALVARESRLCEALLADGVTPEEVAARRLGDLRDDLPDARRCHELRRQLGLPDNPESPAFILPDGRSVPAGELTRWLRTARLVRMSLEVNGGICRSLLRVHRGVEIDDPEEVLT
jgi:metal-sulfur cluster biosynthetic enzyme